MLNLYRYETEYRTEKIPGTLLSELTKAFEARAGQRLAKLHLPEKNPFIPSSFDVEKKEVKEPAKAPRLIRNDPESMVWHKKVKCSS